MDSIVHTYRADNARIAVIGLGYVGLPLAIEFAKKYPVLGFDINQDRVLELAKATDRTQEADIESLIEVIGSDSLQFSWDKEDLRSYNTFIVTVPTPIDEFKSPDLRPLLTASQMLGTILKKGDVVIYESTVYPGCTEEDCIPVLERASSLVFNRDFFAGYSPERINPGDKVNTLTKIRKVTSGSTAEIAEEVDRLYRSIIIAGTHKAPSIKVAEASKAIENAQRDVNISFVNELSLIFDRIGIDTNDVIEAAGTKWNFLKYKPGLVGGHCIGVDPYYLAQKAQEIGYHPEIILAGRRVNDGMGAYVADQLVKKMLAKGISMANSQVLVLGFTFKENCPDVRNTKVIDIVTRLREYQIQVCIHDPLADSRQVMHEYGVICENGESKERQYDAVLLAVAHKEFECLNIRSLCKDNAVIYDIKSMLPDNLVDARL